MNNFIFNDPDARPLLGGYGGTFTTMVIAFINANALYALISFFLGTCVTLMSLYTMYQNKLKNDIDTKIKNIELMQKELDFEHTKRKIQA